MSSGPPVRNVHIRLLPILLALLAAGVLIVHCLDRESPRRSCSCS